jgi:hypothetical protein
MTSRLIAGAAFAVLLLGGHVRAEEPLKSGPQVGAENDRRGFRPQFVTGPIAGKTLCPV